MLSIFVIPVLCALVLRPGPEKESPVMRAARAVYRPLLAWSLRKRALVVCVACSALIASIFVMKRLGTEFIPIMDEGAFDMDVQLLPGISLAKALDLTNLVQKKLKRSQLTTVISRTGQTGIALEARGVDKTGFTGIFKPRDEWETAKDRDEMTENMRAALSGIPGMAFSFSQPIQ
jgi:cobalt-zinc-cadmium resistance protein CzcA